METSVELVVEKLLNVAKDIVPKVGNFVLFVFLYNSFLFNLCNFIPSSGLKQSRAMSHQCFISE